MRKTLHNNLVRSLIGVGALIVIALVGGCKQPDAPSSAPTAQPSPAPKVNFGDVPGLPVDIQKNPQRVLNLIASHSVHARRDPFGLSPQEMAFDREQSTERLLQSNGHMETLYEVPPPPDDTPPPTQQQPYRRVSGILVGDSVVAIIEMGDGKPPQIIRPGQRVGDTEWFVVSIDQERVVLRRAGNVQPTEVNIRLEQKPPGGGGGGANGGAAGPTSGPGVSGGGPGATG